MPRLSRLLVALLLFTASLNAQQKKVLVAGNPTFARELATVTPKARVIPITDANVMAEIPDADAFIGSISSEEVRAAKNLK